MENGQRLRNAGFVKLEVRDDICNFLIQISGLHALDNNTRKLYLTSGDKKEELCDVFLKQGKNFK